MLIQDLRANILQVIPFLMLGRKEPAVSNEPQLLMSARNVYGSVLKLFNIVFSQPNLCSICFDH